MPDQQDGVSAGRVPLRLHVDLRDEWARRVDHVVLEHPGVLVDGRGDSVRRVDDRRTARNVALVLDEDRATSLEVPHDVDVVDDLLPHVHRCAVVVESALDGLDGALDPGAVAAGRGEEDALDAHGSRVLGAVRPFAVRRLRGADVDTGADERAAEDRRHGDLLVGDQRAEGYRDHRHQHEEI